jgi:hypothetical protein
VDLFGLNRPPIMVAGSGAAWHLERPTQMRGRFLLHRENAPKRSDTISAQKCLSYSAWC